jgi:uncharacterized membrane protein
MNDGPDGSNAQDNNRENYQEPIEPELLPSETDPLADQERRLVGYQYRGPLPPNILEEYDKLSPGFAAEYLGSLIKESEHRRAIEQGELQLATDQSDLEKQFLSSLAQRSKLGLGAGFFSVSFVIILCAYMVSKGAMSEAALLAGTILPSLAGVFVVGKLVGTKGEIKNSSVSNGDQENSKD